MLNDDYPIHNSRLLFKTQPHHVNTSMAHQDIVVARTRLKPVITFEITGKISAHFPVKPPTKG